MAILKPITSPHAQFSKPFRSLSYRPLVAAYKAAATCLLERDGLGLVVEHDLMDWVTHMRQAPGVKFIMPTFNTETHCAFRR